MYNLIEYTANHSDESGSSWQFKRDEVPANNVNLTIVISQSFKYKAALEKNKTDYNNQNKVFVILKYLSNSWSQNY